MAVETTVGFIRNALFPGVNLAPSPTLEGPMTRVFEARTPAHGSNHIKKLYRLLKQELVDSEEDRVKLIRELGEKDEAAGAIVVQPGSDAWAEFEKRMGEILSVPVEIPYNPITPEMLGNAEISAADLEALGPFYTGNKEEPQSEKGARK